MTFTLSCRFYGSHLLLSQSFCHKQWKFSDILGVIYLKNMVTQFWQDREAEKPGDPVPFSIHEHDRAAVREHLIEAIIHAPEPVRYDTT